METSTTDLRRPRAKTALGGQCCLAHQLSYSLAEKNGPANPMGHPLRHHIEVEWGPMVWVTASSSVECSAAPPLNDNNAALVREGMRSTTKSTRGRNLLGPGVGFDVIHLKTIFNRRDYI